MSLDDKTLAAVEELERLSLRSRPIMAIGLLGFLAAFIILILLVQREQSHAAERQRLLEETNRKSQEVIVLSQRLAQTIEQLGQGDATPAQVTRAVSEAREIDASLVRLQFAQAIQMLSEEDRRGIRIPPEARSASRQVLTGGQSTGWDVDIFWCNGPAADSNYALGRLLSVLLAAEASRGRNIAPGVFLGRIRLQSYEIAKVMAESGPGTFVVGDLTNGETEAALAVSNFLGTRQRATLSRRRNVNPAAQTPYLLSVFACNGASRAPG